MDAVRPRLRWKQQNLHFVVSLRSAPAKIFEKSIFRTTEALCTKVQKTNPTKFVTFVGLKRMLIRMAGIAFFRVAWYNFNKNM